MEIFLAILIAIVVLSGLSYRDDDRNPAVATQLAFQRKEDEQFMHWPSQPYIEGGATAATSAAAPANPMIAAGEQILQSHSCYTCHGQGGIGTAVAARQARETDTTKRREGYESGTTNAI